MVVFYYHRPRPSRSGPGLAGMPTSTGCQWICSADGFAREALECHSVGAEQWYDGPESIHRRPECCEDELGTRQAPQRRGRGTRQRAAPSSAGEGRRTVDSPRGGSKTCLTWRPSHRNIRGRIAGAQSQGRISAVLVGDRKQMRRENKRPRDETTPPVSDETGGRESAPIGSFDGAKPEPVSG